MSDAMTETVPSVTNWRARPGLRTVLEAFLAADSSDTTPAKPHPTAVVIGTVAVLGLLFQIGHFLEHALQFAIWVLGDLSNICGRDTPWMSAWVTELVRHAGLVVAPDADPARRMMVGMEVLHLVGNTVFLVALACTYYCARSKWVRWAFYIEAFHLYEHVMLTATAIMIGKPIGLSTLFGGTGLFGSREFAVGYRVSWHFALNLLPMPLAMYGMMEHLEARLAARSQAACG